MLCRTGGIASCQDRPAQSSEGSGRLRLQGNGLGEHPFGGVRSIFIEVRSAEPHQRWEIGWTQLQHTLERLRGFGPLAARQVQLPQVIGPAGIRRRQGLRVAQARFGGRLVLSRHQQQADITVRAAQLFGRSLALDGPLEDDLTAAYLLLHGRRQP